MIFFRNSIGIFGIFDSYKPMRAIALVILRCAFALHATRDQIPFRYDDIGTRYGTVGAILSVGCLTRLLDSNKEWGDTKVQ
jgi:hypothetical protein